MNNISNGDTEQADYHFLKKSSESDTLLREKLLQFLLVGCSIVPPQSMMPLAPTMTELPTAHKPKIGFSIDSIVGGGGDTSKGEDTSALLRSSNSNRSRRSSSVDNDRDREHESISPKRESISPELAEKPGGMAALLMKGSRGDVLAPLSHHHHHLHRLASSFPHHAQQALLSAENGNNGSMSPPIPGGMLYHPLHHPHPLRLPLLHAHHSPSLGSNHSSTSHSPPGRVSPTSSTSNNNNNNNNDSIISRVGNNGEKEGLLNSNPSSRSPSPASSSHQVRSPSPNQKSATVSATATSGVGAEISSASPHPEIHHPLVNAGSHHHPRPGLPPGLHPPHPPVGPHGIPPFAAYPPGMLNFAAAAAVAAQAQHHPGLPSWMGQPPHPGGPPHHPPHPAAAAHPLYPWLLAKHSRLFPHRFGPGPDLPGFLFQPFRKPKRIRTAFSPSQLLKLEHAFEKNHYVVGAERKQLAKSLSLSETQVKVWFQNRRTKHKRVEQEEDVMKKSDGSSRASGNSSGSDLPSSGRGDLSTSSISADSSTRNYSEVSDDEEIVMDDEYSDDEEMERQQEHAANMLHNHHHLSKSYS